MTTDAAIALFEQTAARFASEHGLPIGDARKLVAVLLEVADGRSDRARAYHDDLFRMTYASK